jgi:hypothetical protein
MHIRDWEQVFLGDEEQEVDPEQERRRTEHQAYLRDELARWRAMVASWS